MTVTNCGTHAVTITGFTTSVGDFSVPGSEDGCIESLAASQSCTFSVRFTPSLAGTQTANVAIVSNAGIPAVLTAAGTGQTAPNMSLSATSLTFGPQTVGTESAPQTITITNNGNATLNGIGFGMLAASEPIFPFTYTCGPTLAAGASCTFSVAFKPASTGTATATFIVENFSGLPFQQVSLTGNTSQSPLVIGTQANGSTTSTVTAGSTATYALAVTPAAGYSGTVNLSCSNLPVNASCAFSPSSLAITGGTAANVTLSIATGSTQTAAATRTTGFGFALAGIFFLLPFKKRKKYSRALFCLGAALLISAVSACGGGGSSAPAPTNPQSTKVSAGTYTIGVIASDASGNKSTQNLSLIVQ